MEEGQVNHLCAVCNQSFPSEGEYLSHTCPVTSLTPADPEHLINSTTPNFAELQAQALARGAEAQPEGEQAAEGAVTEEATSNEEAAPTE